MGEEYVDLDVCDSRMCFVACAWGCGWGAWACHEVFLRLISATG